MKRYTSEADLRREKAFLPDLCEQLALQMRWKIHAVFYVVHFVHSNSYHPPLELEKSELQRQIASLHRQSGDRVSVTL